MQELRELGQSDLIAGFVRQMPVGSAMEDITGVSLRIDRFWLEAFLSGRRLDSRSQRAARAHGMRYDFTWRPRDWQSYCKSRRRHPESHPVLVVVILSRPERQPKLFDVPQQVGPHPILLEFRPDAISYALRGGDYISAHLPGTLGGILWNSSNNSYFAATCAHVLGPSIGGRVHASKRGTVDLPNEVGTITNTYFPSSFPGIPCNRPIQPHAPTLDFGLVKLDKGVVPDVSQPGAGKIARASRIAEIGDGDSVRFCGFDSKVVDAEIHECNIWKTLKVNGVRVCFGDLFVLRDPRFSHVVTALARGGDSGAWVVHGEEPMAMWDGILIGGDGPNVYCSYSEQALAVIGPHFKLPP